MTSEFKVMPWLRALRDRNAEEERELTIAERLKKHRAESEALVEDFLQVHPEARSMRQQSAARVAEDRAEYGKK